MDDNHFTPQARNFLDSIYSVEKDIYLYRSMAKTNYRGYLQNPLVPIKKYFYVLRPLLSIMWLEKYNQPAPIVFDQLRRLVSENHGLDKEISKLLQRKKISKEKEIVPAIPILNRFIENELNRLEKQGEKTKGQVSPTSSLNDLFHEVLAQVDSNC